MHTGGNKAGEMRHIDHEISADAIGDFTEAGEIDDTRIGRAAGQDQFGFMFFGEAFDLFVINFACF